MNEIRARLFALQDKGYQAFQIKLLPTVSPERVIGVRTPAIRALAKELRSTPQAQAFMAQLPHLYFEEYNLHGALIDSLRDFDACIVALDAFLPYVDNWATCDQTSPKCFKNRQSALLPHVRRWMASPHAYTCRFGIGMLMRWYLDDAFIPEYLQWVASIRSEEYYVNMMIAWFFATALAKQYDAALPYIAQRRLSPWVHNKAIQKALESNRVTVEQKTVLRGMKGAADGL